MLGTRQGSCPLDNGLQQLLFIDFIQKAQGGFVKGAQRCVLALDGWI
jgi:hypothetical protein